MAYRALQNEVQTKAIANKTKLWENGTTIKVKFINGDGNLQNEIMKYASEWEKYCEISFEKVSVGTSDVLIQLAYPNNPNHEQMNWSYLGTDNQPVSANGQPSMNLVIINNANQ